MAATEDERVAALQPHDPPPFAGELDRLTGANLVGVSRIAKDGRTIGYEHMRIAPGPDGRPAFHAAPSGQAPSAFPMAEAGAQSVRFAEPAHDFPKSVQYARDGEALTAAISAEADGEPAAAARWGRFELHGTRTQSDLSGDVAAVELYLDAIPAKRATSRSSAPKAFTAGLEVMASATEAPILASRALDFRL